MSENKQSWITEDFFLQQLIVMVNGSADEIKITLNIGGFLISGQLVSGHKYFEETANRFTNFPGLRDLILKNSEPYSQEDLESNEIRYIHLKDAKFFDTNGSLLSEGVWWRGRVSEVNGFFF